MTRDFVIPRFKLAEVPLLNVGAGTSNNFQQNLDDLNNAYILGFAIVAAEVLSNAPSGRANETQANMPLAAFIFAKQPGQDKQFDTVPLYMTSRELNSGEWFLVEPFHWSPSESILQVIAAGLNTAKSYCVAFLYVPFQEWDSYVKQHR